MTTETVSFSEIITIMDVEFPVQPDSFTDGVRTLSFTDIPRDAIAERDMSIVRVRVPLAHHKKMSQGWLSGSWGK